MKRVPRAGKEGFILFPFVLVFSNFSHFPDLWRFKITEITKALEKFCKQQKFPCFIGCSRREDGDPT